ncbi:unnamed protein product [Mytilus coruscus]|uniref:Uncharacterized protein n=1 Tax=Mytilus coruscus TaxID=42192 RepID=A0A6J8BT68_MYTCO|nr:unnamed protein product [Mytilus coruscus]
MDKRIKSLGNRSVSDLHNEIEKEKALTVDLLQSTREWNDMIEEFENSFKIESDVEPGGTWKTRYAYQCLHNRMLRGQIKEMKTEIRMLKQGKFKLPDDVDWDTLTPAECRRQLKGMHIEITSLRGYKKSIEEKLDSESYAYNTTRDKCDSILNDVWFQQQCRIRDLEKSDRRTLSQYNITTGKDNHTGKDSRVRLPSISPKSLSHIDSYRAVFNKVKTKKEKQKKKAKTERKVSFHVDVK